MGLPNTQNVENPARGLISRLRPYECVCLLGHDSPGNAEHHHTDDDHLECSDDRGDENVVQFARAWHHVEHVVLFGVTLGAAETRVTAGGGGDGGVGGGGGFHTKPHKRKHTQGGRKRRKKVISFAV